MSEKQDDAETREVFNDDAIVFIHQDYTVTQSMLHDENVIFNRVGKDWQEFCQSALSFNVPDDLNLIGAVNSQEERHRPA